MGIHTLSMSDVASAPSSNDTSAQGESLPCVNVVIFCSLTPLLLHPHTPDEGKQGTSAIPHFAIAAADTLAPDNESDDGVEESSADSQEPSADTLEPEVVSSSESAVDTTGRNPQLGAWTTIPFVTATSEWVRMSASVCMYKYVLCIRHRDLIMYTRACTHTGQRGRRGVSGA